jgi:hypothetical protein
MAPSVGGVAVSDGMWLLQAFDPTVVVDAPAPVRAAVAVVLTVAVGGGVIYRYGGRIDLAVDASMARPLLSVVYGLIAFGLVTFFIVYAYSQVVRVGVGTTIVTLVAGVVLGGVLLGLASLGFVVVGAWLAASLGMGDVWAGLVGMALVGGLVLLVLPPGVGLLVWLVIAAVGVGGPARRWVHADAGDVDV